MDMVEAARSPEHHCKAGCNTLDRCACALLEDMADEIERLRDLVVEIVYCIGEGDIQGAMNIAAPIAESALQQKDSE